VNNAKKEIFITDWAFVFLNILIFIYFLKNSFAVYFNLIRDFKTKKNSSRIDLILAKKASEGVKIKILIYNENENGLNLNSTNIKKILNNIHPNIKCINHPKNFQYWSHHQKTVVVDRKIAFVGGVN
jgi:phospholipase D1/2